jgi:DNA-binding Lrp family transcriptional regulator
MSSPAPDLDKSWTFLTNHAHVLLAMARDPEIRQRDIARLVGVTERATQKIVAELEAAGYVTRERIGRRNRYAVDLDQPLRHRLDGAHPVGDILRPLGLPR